MPKLPHPVLGCLIRYIFFIFSWSWSLCCLTTFTCVMSFDSRSKGSTLCSLYCVRHATVHSFKGRARYKTVCIHHNSTKAKLWSNSCSEFQMLLYLAIPCKELLLGPHAAYIMFFNLYLPIFDRVDIKRRHPLTSRPLWKDSGLWLPFMWRCERLLCLLMRASRHWKRYVSSLEFFLIQHMGNASAWLVNALMFRDVRVIRDRMRVWVHE